MKNNIVKKILSVVLSFVLMASVIVGVPNQNVLASENNMYETESIGDVESYTFDFNKGKVIETVANTTVSKDADGNEFKPFMSQSGMGTDTATQCDIDTNGDGVNDVSALKLSLTGWNSVYIPTNEKGEPYVVKPNTTYNVSMNVYVEAKSAHGQFFIGGGVESQYAQTGFKSGGLIYDGNAVYNGGALSSLRTGSSSFTTGDYKVSNNKFTLDDTEYQNYLYFYSGLCSETFDGVNMTASVVYIDSITITEVSSPTPIGFAQTYEFDSVKASTSTDIYGNTFAPFMSQNGRGTDTATKADIDIDGDGQAETSTLKWTVTGWNSVFIPTDENGYPYLLEPNTTYSVKVNAYVYAQSAYSQISVGGGLINQYGTLNIKSGCAWSGTNGYYNGGYSPLKTATLEFTTGDYTISNGKFVYNDKEYLNYFYLYTGGCDFTSGAYSGPTVFNIDSVTITKKSQTANITFDANGGAFKDGTASLSAVQSVGGNFTAEAPTTTQGGVFAGWSYTENGMPIDKVTSAMNGKTLYAIYKNPVNITLNANGGTFENSASVIETTQFDGVYLIYDAPTNNTDKFIGWATSPTATEKLASYKVTSGMEGTTLYAVWEKKPHGSYSTFERVVDYSKYTVNAWSGGNTWWAENNPDYPWFTLVNDENADGGKYLRFKTPHDDCLTGEDSIADSWLGHFGITMTESGRYNSSGEGEENLYLPENTTYRVTLKIRTRELSGRKMNLYVAYGQMHHMAEKNRTNLISEIGEMNDWTEISAVFTTPSEYNGNNKLCFIGLHIGGGAEFEYHLDSVKLERVTATNIFINDNGVKKLVDTYYGVPGEALILPEEIVEEYYETNSSKGGLKITTLGKLYDDENCTEEAILKYANFDYNLYCKEIFEKKPSMINQDGYCGFDNYFEKEIGSAYDKEVISITSEESYTGTHSLKAELLGNNTGVFEIRNSKDILVKAGKTYKVSFSYKANKETNALLGLAQPKDVLNDISYTNSFILEPTDNWKTVSFNICADGAYEDSNLEYVLGMALNSKDNATIYIDNIVVSSGVSVVGAVKDDNGIRFMMSYVGEDNIVIEDEIYDIEERGILVKGKENNSALTVENANSNGIVSITQKDFSVNWSKNTANNTTIYSVFASGIAPNDTYELSTRGYLKLKNGDVFYTEEYTTCAKDITENIEYSQKTVLCIGDDNTYGWDKNGQAEDTYPSYVQTWGGERLNVINAGLNGAKVVDGSDSFAEKIVNSDIALIMLGTNDVKSNWNNNKNSYKAELATLVNRVKEKNANADIWICTSPYRPDDAYKASQLELVDIQKDFAKENGYNLIDVYTAMEEAQKIALSCTFSNLTLYEDDVHLNSNGRGILAKIIYDAIKNEYTLPEISDERDAALEIPSVYTYPNDKEIIEETNLFGDEVFYGYVDGTRKWQGISGIEYIEYKNYSGSGQETGGRLWATWYSGGASETGCNYIILATSDDEGITWSDARVIVDPDNIGPVRAFDSVLWVDPNNRLWLFWNQEYETYTHDGRKGVWGMYTDNPYSMDPEWSTPVRLCNGVMMNKPTVINDENGETAWVLPSYCYYFNYQTNVKELGPNLYKFVDYDKPWETYSNINGEKQIVAIDAFFEHMLIQNSDDTLRVIIRTADGLKEVVSNDYGKSWSDISFVKDADTIVSKTNSRPFIRTIMDSDGKTTGNTQILIYHDNTTGERANLTVALSEDSGKTWPYKIEIEAALGCSYPDAVQSSNGTIYITYDFDRYNKKKIMLARITVDDIKAGSVVSDVSELGLIINSNGVFMLENCWYSLPDTENISEENMASIVPTDNVSVLKKLKLGMNVFVDRGYISNALPSCFKDAQILTTSMNTGTSFKAVEAGEVYVLTPMTGEACSQQAVLQSKGFSVVIQNITGFFTSQAEKLVLMKKMVEVDEEITIAKYSVVLSASDN